MADFSSDASQGIILVQDRSALTGPNSADMEVLAKLDEKLRFIETKKVNAQDPTYYLALDQISVGNSTALEASIKKVADMAQGGKNRVAYLYPMLVSHHSKPAFQLFLFYPSKNKMGVRDAAPLRRAAFAKSEPLLRSLLESKRARPTDVAEEDPGAALVRPDVKGVNFYPNFYSLEYDFRRLLKKAYDKLQIAYIETPDFFTDLNAFFKRNEDLIDSVGSDYHIVIDQLELDSNGNYTRVPEVIRHYRILADGLEKFVLNVLLGRAKTTGDGVYVSRIENYRTTHVLSAEPNRKQNKEKVDALLELASAYPHDRIRDRDSAWIREKLNSSIEYLRLLIQKKDTLVNRKQTQTVSNTLEKLENMVQTNTRQNLDLLQLDLSRELARTIKDEAQLANTVAEFEKRLMTRFGAHKIASPSGASTLYLVDQKYISSVLENLSRQMRMDGGAAERYEIANLIYEKLVERKDPAIDQGLSAEERMNLSQMRAHNINENAEKQKAVQKARQYNVPQGILVSLISVILFIAAMFYSTQLFWLAFPLTLLSVVAFYRIHFDGFTKKQSAHSEGAENKSNGSASDSASLEKETRDQAAQTKQKINSVGSSMVFPYMPQKASERVLTEDEFQAKVRMAAPELKKQIPELRNLNGKALEQTVYEALRDESVCIVIPTEIVKKSLNKVPVALYIDYRDFSSEQMRTKIADEYRSIFKPNLKEYEQEFYRYLINTLEVKYYTYLKKNLKK